MAFVVSSIVIFFSVATLCLPKKDYSENENRHLEEFPEFSFEELKSGQYVQKLERYFVTKKMPRYIFYDEKEQDLLRLLFTSAPLTCQVSLMSSKGGWHQIPFDKLTSQGYSNLRDMLGQMTLQAEIGLESYLRLMNVHIKPKKDIDKVISDRILAKYESLNVSTLVEYKKAKKKIQKSLHPDMGGDADEFDEFVKSIEQLETTKWFKSLEGGKS